VSRADIAKKLVNEALVELCRKLAAAIGQDEAFGALASCLTLHAIDYSRRAGVPEEMARVWIEECFHNIYRRGVDIQTWREPS